MAENLEVQVEEVEQELQDAETEEEVYDARAEIEALKERIAQLEPKPSTPEEQISALSAKLDALLESKASAPARKPGARNAPKPPAKKTGVKPAGTTTGTVTAPTRRRGWFGS